MNPILIFFIQIPAWFVCAFIISDPYLPPWIAWIVTFAPFLFSWIAWRVPIYRLAWPFKGAPPDARKLQVRRRWGIAIAVFFLFGHLTVSEIWRYSREDIAIGHARAQIESEAANIMATLSAYADNHGGAYPASLSDLPREQPGEYEAIGPDRFVSPDETKLDDQTVQDLDQFEFLTAGLKMIGGPIAILTSRSLLPARARGIYTDAAFHFYQDDWRMIYTEDMQYLWVSDAQYNAPNFHSRIVNHQPIAKPSGSYSTTTTPSPTN